MPTLKKEILDITDNQNKNNIDIIKSTLDDEKDLINFEDDFDDDDTLNSSIDTLFNELKEGNLDSRKETLAHYYTGRPATAQENKIYFDNLKSAKTEEERKKAIDVIVKKNSALVLHYASKYAPNSMDAPMFSDYVQDGFLGLMTAIEKFKPELGYSFSTYATSWILQRLRRPSMDYKSEIRYPCHIMLTLQKIRAATTKYMAENDGELPTPEELAKMTKTDVTKIKDVLALRKNIVSLDTIVSPDDGSGDGTTLGELIADDSDGAEDVFLKTEAREGLLLLLESTLNEKELYVIKERFGLDTGVSHTLEEVGRTLNVTRERIRQIESGAIKKLRIRAKKLHIKLDDFI